ncbi:GNAT family N-acetyltransferase [Evansella clarkii]|uniref:GNAT family N-acetyltransferase n=1 Tax=Evansella clarkii TaxID=79879 RepID=UPI0014303C30
MEIKDIYEDLPVLETERLILRKITMDDAEAMFSYASIDEVSQYVTWETHQTLDDSKSFISHVLKQYNEGMVAPWGIELKENGKFIGTIDFVWWKPRQKTAEIGYVVSPEYWGRGITTEALREVIKFGFLQMKLVRIQGRCILDNTGSLRVMSKSGMQYEGTARKSMLIKGRHEDILTLSITDDDFATRRDIYGENRLAKTGGQKLEIAEHYDFMIGLARLIKKFSEEEWRTLIAPQKWSIAEVMGHLTRWDEFLLENRLPYLFTDEPLPPAPDVESFNQESARLSRESTKEEIIEQFISVKTKIYEILLKTEPEVWGKNITIGSRQLTFYEYFEGLKKHDRHHLDQIISALPEE